MTAQITTPSSQRAFSLVELMITLTVMAILLSIAAPSFNDATLGSKLSTYGNNLVASAALARSEAIKRNSSITLCVSSDGNSCGAGGWEQGWIVLMGTTVIQRQPAAASGLKITETNGKTSLSFQPTGLGATSATLTVCRATPSVGSQERVVTISVTGRTTISKTTTGACS